MLKILTEYIRQKLLAPFSNKVTRTLLYLGGSLLLFPTIKYIILDLVLQGSLGAKIPFDYPSKESLFVGLIILVTAVAHNLLHAYLSSDNGKVELDIGERRLKGVFKIEEIKELINLIPESKSESLDYDKLREKYQPLITRAVWEIDNGHLEKGRLSLCEVLDELPLGIVGSAYLNYGYYLSCKGSDEDEEYYLTALRIFRNIGFKEGAAKLYQNLGEAARSKHDFEKALVLQEKSVELRRQIGDEIDLADALSSLGLVHAQQCKHELAERIFNESIELYRKHEAHLQVKRVRSYIDTLKSCPYY